MNRPDEPKLATPPTDRPSGTGDQAAVDDPRVIAAVEEYLAAIESGTRPDRRQFLARYPHEVASALAECLDGLELVQSAGAELQPRPAGVRLKVLGDFRLIREVGRGGMGIVYEAEQLSLRRRVALKVLSAAGGLDERQLQRFRTEAQAAGSLNHPHIAPVYAVGCEHGVHFYAMQFIDGPSLASVIAVRRGQAGLSPAMPVGHYGLSSLSTCSPGADGDPSTVYKPLDRLDEAIGGPPSSFNGSPSLTTLPEGKDYWREAARLGIEAAEALDHAHEQGIVHRDIKPANLLLDGHGNLWVVDFGLARLPTDAGLTMTGDLVGTLRYMSPEQALAKRAVVDQRTDVYSLGATLYELLTLTPAFPGNDRQDVLRRIANEDPPAPRRLNPSIPPELETIVLKALAKEPTERYVTAQELADDLHRFLEDRPILARRPSLTQRGRRWARRHRPLVLCVSGTTVALGIGLVIAALFFAFQQRQFGEEQKRDAEKQKTLKELAEEARQQAQAALSDKSLQHAATVRGEHLAGYRAAVWDDLRLAAKLDVPGKDREAIAAEVLACLGDSIGLPLVENPDAPRAFPPPPAAKDGVQEIQAPTGQVRAWFEGDIVTVQLKGHHVPDKLRSPMGQVKQLRLSGDGSLLAAGCEKGLIIWNIPSLSVRSWFGGESTFALALHPTSRLLATVGRQVKVYSLVSNHLVSSMPVPGPMPQEVEFSADGQLLLGFVNGKARYGWPVGSTPEKRRLDGHQDAVTAVTFSPDGGMVASVSKDREVKLWDAGSGRLLHAGRKHADAIESVAFSPDGRLFVTGGLDGTVNVWSSASGALLARLLTPRLDLEKQIGPVWRLQFDAAGKWLAAAGTQGVAAWAVPPGAKGASFERRVNLRINDVYDLALRPDGSALALLVRAKPDQPGQLYRYELDRQEAPKPLDLPAQVCLRALAFDSSGRLLTYVTRDGRLGRWDWEKGVALPAVGADQEVSQTTLTPDGRWAAIARPDRSVSIYELETGKRVLALPPEESDIWGLAWAPDGRRVAVSLADGGVAVWDLEQVCARLAEFGIDRPWKPAAK
jgi:serine/threonine protein kinase/WD40 repeat protein